MAKITQTVKVTFYLQVNGTVAYRVHMYAEVPVSRKSITADLIIRLNFYPYTDTVRQRVLRYFSAVHPSITPSNLPFKKSTKILNVA